MRPQTELRSKAERVILKTLKKGGAFTTKDLIYILHGICSKSSVYHRVDVLEAKGYIRYMGDSGKGTAVWSITGKAKGKVR